MENLQCPSVEGIIQEMDKDLTGLISTVDHLDPNIKLVEFCGALSGL